MELYSSARRWLTRFVIGALAVTSLGAASVGHSTATANLPDEKQLISTDTTQWKYLDDGTDPVSDEQALRAWTETDFDDSAWKQAKGSFGAKRGALAPVGPYMPNTKLEHYLPEQPGTAVPTYFFRTSFELTAEELQKYRVLTGEVRYDDGLVMWINGQKVAGFSDQRVTEDANQQYAGSGASNPATESFTASTETLKEGTNTVAFGLYQDRPSSSDIYLDVMELNLLETLQEDPPSRVILTPTQTPETSQYVSWLAGSAEATDGFVEVRTPGSAEVRTVAAELVDRVNNNPRPHFTAELTGLNPATTYEYRVANGESLSDWYTFSTADPNQKDFQYLYFGDAQIGLDTTWPKVVKQAFDRAPRAVGSVHAGDLIDTASNETQWENWFKGMAEPATRTNVLAAPGNHEYSGDNKLRAWKANFEYPRNNPSTETVGQLAQLAQGDSPQARQYKALFEHWTEFAEETVYFSDYQDVRFITINATRSSGFLTPDNMPSCAEADCPAAQISELWIKFQAAWLDHVLTTSPSKWNVVTFHQPVYSASAGRNEPVLRKHWVPVFQKHNIDLVQMGHDHVYARGFNNDNKTDHEGVTDGPVYIVSNSGAKHYQLETDERNVWTNNNAAQVRKGRGFTTYQVIDVSADTLTYRSYIAEKTSTATTDLQVGDLWDEFTVTKNDAGQKWVTEAGVDVPEDVELVESSLRQRCIAGKVVLNVAVKNVSAAPLSIALDSRYGSKASTEVAAGKFSSTAFNTRAQQSQEGAIKVTVSAAGTQHEQQLSVPAFSCK